MASRQSQQVVLTTFGQAEEVVRLQISEIPDPSAGQILIEMKSAPVNPADLNVIEGTYGIKPELPAVIGNEGVGCVVACGSGVTGWKPGDLVRPPEKVGTWRQFLLADAAKAIRFPDGVPIPLAAQMYVNPATAWRMMHDFVTLEKGEWLLQNAANSAVGRCVIQIAREKGWKTLNLVRRAELVGELKAIGADEVLVEDETLKARMKEVCIGKRIRLALNAVGGESASTLAKALAKKGVMVTYGAMSKQPLTLPNGLLIFNDLQARGFWMTRWYQESSPQARGEMFAALGNLMKEGKLALPVEKEYPIAEIHAALAHARQDKRGGKILLRF